MSNPKTWLATSFLSCSFITRRKVGSETLVTLALNPVAVSTQYEKLVICWNWFCWPPKMPLRIWPYCRPVVNVISIFCINLRQSRFPKKIVVSKPKSYDNQKPNKRIFHKWWGKRKFLIHYDSNSTCIKPYLGLGYSCQNFQLSEFRQKRL